MQTLVKKKFVLYYNPDFPAGERVQLVEGMRFFTRGTGFSRHDIEDVEKLEVDDTVNTGPLKIWRVK